MDVIDLDHMTNELAAANIAAYAREGRLEQHTWHGEAEGRKVACLLGAIHPDIDSTDACPANLMPEWMARLTVRLFDGVATASITAIGEAYAARLHRWSALDAEAWERVRKGFITETLADVVTRARAKAGENPPEPWGKAVAIINRLAELLLDPSTPLSAFRALRDEAYGVRRAAWDAWHAARQRRAEEEAVAAEAAAAVAEAAVAAEAAAAVAEAAVAAVAEAAVAAEAAAAEAAEAAAAEAEAAEEAERRRRRRAEEEAEAAEARRDSYARSFATLFRLIDEELPKAA
ncbi:MAG: hypothetical protein WDM92_16615 [Caulobacteraceae bacterium]